MPRRSTGLNLTYCRLIRVVERVIHLQNDRCQSATSPKYTAERAQQPCRVAHEAQTSNPEHRDRTVFEVLTKRVIKLVFPTLCSPRNTNLYFFIWEDKAA